ncbi:MAG: transcription termination/antitermination protein NusG [Bacteroidales bacterium]|nr:transcription termination/antitermination factor NusG [Candidatus Colimorpha merdihippi]MCQ2281387.1 transcription termination/antitermination protein NusG [Bacteroidales bacterium]
MDQSKKWYVVRAISGKEKKAKEYIESEVAKRGWNELVPQVLIPTEKVFSVRNGKKVVKDRNFFPGYVLIEADLREEIIPVLQNVPNVLDFLRESGGGKPIPMREAEINRILGKMDDQLDAVDSSSDDFLVGETVKVIDGAFSSFSGVVEEVNDEKKKLKVTVKIFGRKTPLELGFNQVEKQ